MRSSPDTRWRRPHRSTRRARGHPALDFVNTLGERPFDRPIENLATYRDLVRFAQAAALALRKSASLIE